MWLMAPEAELEKKVGILRSRLKIQSPEREVAIQVIGIRGMTSGYTRAA
jgi:hypothetical protein